MCLRPISIFNPNYARKSYASERGSLVDIPRYQVPKDMYIEVPCCKCAECRQMYFNSILQRALVESRSSYMFFVTLTYDNKHVPRIELPTGDIVMYSDYTHIKDMFKRLRANKILDRDFRYISVSEYGDQFARPHFHLLIFVAKKDSDNSTTPFTIERTLWTNLKKYYAVNVGTRKNPKYEPLFTYKYRITSKGPKTNYFVKYVEPHQHNRDAYAQFDDTTSIVKTIRYLIGYINKSSSFDNVIIDKLMSISDLKLRDKLISLLKSKVRYSKGFGCGFTDGKKDYLPRISVKSSFSTIYYSDLLKTLPDTFAEFVESYPDKVESLVTFVKRQRYSFHFNLDLRIKTFDAEDYFNHCLIMKYFPYYLNEMINRFYRRKLCSEPRVSYFFNREHFFYKKSVVHTEVESPGDVYSFIRSGIEEALRSRVPYIAFKTVDGFTSLCKYYRERCSDISDVETLYFINQFQNYEDWKDSFVKQLDYKKANKFNANNQIYENNDKIICKNQKSYLDLPKPISGVELYTTLLTDCNRRK